MKRLLFSLLLLSALTINAQDFPEELATVDLNGDQIIQVGEVETVIDGYFSSNPDFTVEFIHGLIDFFFEQPII